MANGKTIGFVLAGGRSARMGRDKALLPFGEGRLLDHAIARLRGACDEVKILCGPAPRYEDWGLEVLPDLVPGAGPLGGVLTGLVAAAGCPGLFLAVDLPRVPVDLLRFLVGCGPTWDAAVPVHSKGEEPLCALYGAACLGPVRSRVEAGDLKVTSFWRDVRMKRITEDEMRPFGDPSLLFSNLNAPEDLEEP